MKKSYYLISWKLDFYRFLRESGSPNVADMDEPQLERLLIGINQGGFGQDSLQEIIQVKERFLEFACQEYDIELPRTIEAFDNYFELIEPDYFIDLDEEL